MKNHYYVIGGGIFSLLVQGIMQNFDKIDTSKEYYFEPNMLENLKRPQFLKDGRIYPTILDEINVCNPFNFIFDQSMDNINAKIELYPQQFFHRAKPISTSSNLKEYHKLYLSLNWREELLKEFKGIDSLLTDKDYLGVHCRLTTMNFYNGTMTSELFMQYVDQHIKNKKLIVVSDNEESLNKFIDRYGEETVIYNKNQSTRFAKETDDIFKLQTTDFLNFFTKEFWFNGLKEAYLLSKASTVIKRTSNLNSMSTIIRGVPQHEIHVPGSL